MSLAAVFQIGSLGDSLVSVPSLLSLKEFIPNCDEYLLVSRFDSALKVLPSHVFDMAWKPKTIVNFKGPNKGLRELASIASLVRQLRHYKPRHCVYLMPASRSQSQVERDKLFFRAAGVKDFVGFRTLTESERTPSPNAGFTDTEAFRRFRRIWNQAAETTFPRYSAPPMLKPSSAAFQKVTHRLASERKHPHRRLVAVCPYSNSPSKDIPDQVTVDLLPRLEELAGVESVILGGHKDFDRVQNLIRQAGTGINVCGLFSVEESAALLSTCSLAICADSGPMHLAAALGTPSLVAFSRMNTQLRQWFPLGHGNSLLYRDVPCAGCRLVHCSQPGHPCMRDITVDQILQFALRKLAGVPLPVGLLGDTIVSEC